MKILYFYQYFSTPKGSWGTRVYEFAKNWVEEGHDVTVVTSIYSKSDITATDLVEDQYFDGIHVKVLNVYLDNKQSVPKRIFSFLKYSFLSSYYALTLPADIVIGSSGPITAAIPALVAKFIRRRKMVFETRDLWPDGAIELGLISNPLLKRLSYAFERFCYKSSDYVVTLSPGMTNDIRKRFMIKNIDDVTNAANIKMFSTKVDFQGSVVSPFKYAIYTGNIGEVNNSSWLFEAAKKLKEIGRQDIKILLIGDGQQKQELISRAISERVDNFIVLDLMPKQELVGFIQNALVSLVPLKGTPVLDTSSPNKFFESLAAGIPVIQNTQGWMKDFLQMHNIGLTIDPDNPLMLAEVLDEFSRNIDRVRLMGMNAKRVAEAHFDKDLLAEKMLGILQRVSNSKCVMNGD